MKFAIITALFLAAGASAAYVPKDDGTYTVCTPNDKAGICKKYDRNNKPTGLQEDCRWVLESPLRTFLSFHLF
ncbi:hypothetical protein EG327_003555 [Venturia inaequalis]|uniref:FAS1 domain-containing protein n=1 Tax=Venturia inaequalis TaxID=5025 RepID=A0A8H3ZD80_VENIN|nr:hypothetical protein EG327_003555 [Venturia inaequalis]